MGSLDYAQVRSLLSRGVVRQVGTDTPIAIRLRYIGDGTVTSVTVTTATNIVMVTSDGGTDTYAFATYATLGALVDAINADGIFEAVIVDALRSDASASTIVTGAITAGTDRNGVRVWDAKADTGEVDSLTVVLSPVSPDFDAPEGHRVHLQEVVYNVDVSAGGGTVTIVSRRGANETVIYSGAAVDATLTTINFASGNGKITGAADEELVVRVKDGTALADAATNFVRVIGIVE